MEYEITDQDRGRIERIARRAKASHLVYRLESSFIRMKELGYSEKSAFRLIGKLARVYGCFGRSLDLEEAIAHYRQSMEILGERAFSRFLRDEVKIINYRSEAIGIRMRMCLYKERTPEEQREIFEGRREYPPREFPNHEGEEMDEFQEVIYSKSEDGLSE